MNPDLHVLIRSHVVYVMSYSLLHQLKRGSSVVNALTSRTKGTGIISLPRQGNFGVRTSFPFCHLQK